MVFTLLGGGAGYLPGGFAPDYYRVVFRLPPHIELDPVQAGIGLGLTQGFAVGAVIGLVIVLAVAWYQSRLDQLSE